MSKGTDSPGGGSVRAGLYTATSLLLVSSVAAGVGVIIARKFGRTDETDGLLAAYGVFVVLAIAAQAIRLAVLPDLSRAKESGRLASEVAAQVLALTLLAVPLIVVAEVGAHALGWLLTGGGSEIAQSTAADGVRWMVPAAIAYLFAGIAASALAALDDYGTAAFGFAAGSALGFGFILARADADGIIAVARGMTLNALVAFAVPTVALALRALHARMPRHAVRPGGPPLQARLRAFAVSAALPLALQLLYVICLPFAGRIGTGAATSFVYSYLAAASLVAVTAASLGLATSVPLSRRDLHPEAVAHHIVSASWLALTLIGAAAGVFALAGGRLVESVLGGSYAGDVGAELGRLVVSLSPWMLASVGVSVSFPLAFVVARTSALPWIGLGALVIQVPLAWAGSTLFDLEGLAVSLALSTLVVLVWLLRELHVSAAALRGLFRAGGTIGVIAVVSFAAAALVPGAAASAAVGLLAYVALLALVRPTGLGTSWRYLRALG